MRTWFRRIRGALGMGITWALGWAFVGGVIEVIQNIVPGWNGTIVDIWPAALGFPAFFGGVIFSGILGVAGRRRRLDELSMSRFAVWGALGGLLLMVPFLVLLGVAPETIAATGLVTALCSSSAAGSLALARRAEDRELLEASADVAAVGLSGDEARELLGEGG